MNRTGLRALLEASPGTVPERLGFSLADRPSPLYRLLVAATLYSAPIRAESATRAARALFARGWTTPEKMARAPRRARTRALNRAGYARFDERTAAMLGAGARLLIEAYGGDLRRLRAAGGCDPARERALLKAFPGIGDVGVDIFFRDAQAAWSERAPFADARALAAAPGAGLPADAARLSALAGPGLLPRLLAALAAQRRAPAAPLRAATARSRDRGARRIAGA